MKKIFICVISVLFLCLAVSGQNLFLIGEKSYPCINSITLMSNSFGQSDLDIFIGKDGSTGVFGISTRSRMMERIIGKLIIYLEDGNVLSFNESVASENVDDDAKALFNLTADQLIKLKSSNIHTVKYTTTYLGGQNYSASNKGVITKDLITKFFSE